MHSSLPLQGSHPFELGLLLEPICNHLFLCSAAIAWKSCIQPVVATSLIEAKFYAGITCAKATKYLCYVVEELDAL